MEKKKVIIIGAGFGGLTAAKELNTAGFEILLIDRTNHHLFQPLLYQVATAALSPADIAVPIRYVFSKQKNVTVLLGEVTHVDLDKRKVFLEDKEFIYDYLIIATGTRHSYFGNERWEKYAPGLKTLDDALKIRENILFSMEQAELIETPFEREKYLTFVVIGGGPTGVEMAGAIAEISKETIIKDFRRIKPEETKVILIEAADKILSSYSEYLSTSAQSTLEKMGVDVKLNAKVIDIDKHGVYLIEGFIPTTNVIWAAGNNASPLLKSLNTELDRAGRVVTDFDLSVKSFDNVFVIGDAANYKDEKGNTLPGVAQVAMQQGKYIASNISAGIEKSNRKRFRYVDKGSMATIGKAKAVANIYGFEFKGFLAWLIWSFIHVLFLISFRNRLKVMAEWIWFYFSSRQGIRLITKIRSEKKKKSAVGQNSINHVIDKHE